MATDSNLYNAVAPPLVQRSPHMCSTPSQAGAACPASNVTQRRSAAHLQRTDAYVHERLRDDGRYVGGTRGTPRLRRGMRGLGVGDGVVAWGYILEAQEPRIAPCGATN